MKNVSDLRDHMIDILVALRRGEITMQDAVASAKVCDSVLDTMKLQIEQAKFARQEIMIPFLALKEESPAHLLEGKILNKEEAKNILEQAKPYQSK